MVKGGVTLLLLLMATATFAAEKRPVVTLNGERVLASLPDTILKDARVRSRLESALTTTFILKTSSGGASRIEIRYDLWDEVYRVRRDRAARQEVAKAQLESWWQTPIDVGRAGERRAVDVELIVLPFSAAEEKDARQWLSKSGGAGTPAADPSSIVDVLIGTTLTAKPIVSFRWSVEIPKR